MPKQSKQYITDRAVRGMFYSSIETGNLAWVDRIAERVDSDQENETYAFLGDTPAMNKRVGPKGVKPLREYKFVIANEDHDATLDVRKRDLERDKTGQIERRIAELSTRAMQYPAKLLSALIEAGEATATYDGKNYFATDHESGSSGVQSNLLSFDATANGAPTVAEFTKAMLQGVELMYGLKDDQGEPLNDGASSFDVMVPVAQMAIATQALALPQILDGGQAVSNPVASLEGFDFNLVVNPRFSASDSIYLFRSDGVRRPLIIQEEIPLDIVTLGPDSEHCAKTGRCIYSAEWTGNAGQGRWQHACKVSFD